MSEFGVSPSKLMDQTGDFDTMQSLINSNKNSIDSIASGIAFTGDSSSAIRSRLRSVSGRLDNAERNMRSMKNALSNISSTYARTEQRIKDNAILPKITISSDGIMPSAADSEFATESKHDTVSADGTILTAEVEAEANAYKNENEMGVNAKIDMSASVAEGSASVDMEYASGAVSGSFMTAEAAAAIAAKLGIKDGQLYGELSAGAGIEASVAHAEAEGKLGTDNINIHGEAEGNLVGAGASANTGVSVDENGNVKMEAKAEAEAYLAKGEVSAGFNLFGIKVDVEAEGMIGVQAEAGGEISSSGVELDLGLGPVGGKLSIDWTGFELPKFSDIDWTFWD